MPYRKTIEGIAKKKTRAINAAQRDQVCSTDVVDNRSSRPVRPGHNYLPRSSPNDPRGPRGCRGWSPWAPGGQTLWKHKCSGKNLGCQWYEYRYLGWERCRPRVDGEANMLRYSGVPVLRWHGTQQGGIQITGGLYCYCSSTGSVDQGFPGGRQSRVRHMGVVARPKRGPSLARGRAVAEAAAAVYGWGLD